MDEKHQCYKELSKTIKDGAGLQVIIMMYAYPQSLCTVVTAQGN